MPELKLPDVLEGHGVAAVHRPVPRRSRDGCANRPLRMLAVRVRVFRRRLAKA